MKFLKILFINKDKNRHSDDLSSNRLTTKTFLSRIFKTYIFEQSTTVSMVAIAMVITSLSTATLPYLIQISLDSINSNIETSKIFYIPALIILVSIIRNFSEYVARVGKNYVGENITSQVRVSLFQAILTSQISWIAQHRIGRLTSIMLNDTVKIREACTSFITALFGNSTKVIALIVTMIMMDPRLALITLIVLPLAAFLISKQRKKLTLSLAASLSETGDLGNHITQILRNIRIVKAYNNENHELTRMNDISSNMVRYSLQAYKRIFAAGPIMETLCSIGFAAAIAYGSYQGIKGSLTIGELSGFITSAILIYEPLKSLSTAYTQLQNGVSAGDRIFGIMDNTKEENQLKGIELKNVKGEIKFENISFEYKNIDNQTIVLSNFSTIIPAGKKTAIVGPSGAGKSTIIDLILGLYKPQSGKIYIDGQNIEHINLKSIRHHIALVTQQAVMFDETIMNNIRYGLQKFNKKDVVSACKAAEAHDFIQELPLEYNTIIGESGDTLSGGQKQRIAFARAILKHSSIVLLDEPTSSLDQQNEEKISKTIQKFNDNQTVVVVSHRASVVKECDNIIVIDKGKIVEQGKHKQLLKNKQLYYNLFFHSDIKK